VICAAALIFVVFAIAGAETGRGRGRVSETVPGQPAAEVMKVGDVIAKVDGAPVSVGLFQEAVKQSEGRTLTVTVIRDGQEVDLTLTPKQRNGTYQLGVKMDREPSREPIGIGRAAVESVKYTYLTSNMILVNLWEVARRPQDAEVTGPVGIADMLNTQVRAGWVSFFEILAVLSVYLGLFNLLPLPALDGSRLAFLVYEIATRRRPNPKVETAVHMAGTVVLLVVMVLVLFKDIRKVVG
jgi:regulator of sigma E protease